MKPAAGPGPDPIRVMVAKRVASCRNDPAWCVFRHFSKAYRAIAGQYDRGLRRAGLTAHQFTVLMTLGREGPVSVGALAALVGTDPSTIPRLLGPLRSRRLVSVRVGADRRSRQVDVTMAGARRLAGAIGEWDRLQTTLVTAIGPPGWRSVVARFRTLRQVAAGGDPV